jgi:hypothetical protein
MSAPASFLLSTKLSFDEVASGAPVVVGLRVVVAGLQVVVIGLGVVVVALEAVVVGVVSVIVGVVVIVGEVIVVVGDVFSLIPFKILLVFLILLKVGFCSVELTAEPLGGSSVSSTVVWNVK